MTWPAALYAVVVSRLVSVKASGGAATYQSLTVVPTQLVRTGNAVSWVCPWAPRTRSTTFATSARAYPTNSDTGRNGSWAVPWPVLPFATRIPARAGPLVAGYGEMTAVPSGGAYAYQPDGTAQKPTCPSIW